jgi:hypothetical protein
MVMMTWYAASFGSAFGRTTKMMLQLTGVRA